MHNIFSINKMLYCKGGRPEVDCIFCEIVKKTGKVIELEIFRNDLVIIVANLYPYNPGHLLISPIRHVNDPRNLNKEESSEIDLFMKKSMDILDDLYQPHGFNAGYNIGSFGGASIEHLHLHIVPRYENELGFVDIIGGSKIYIEDPVETMEKLKKAFS